MILTSREIELFILHGHVKVGNWTLFVEDREIRPAESERKHNRW